MLNDLRHATRSLLRTPGFALVSVMTLALGIGGTSAIFTVVNRTLLHPLPFPDAERLVVVWGSKPHEGLPEIHFSQPDFEDYRRQARVFEWRHGHRLDFRRGGRFVRGSNAYGLQLRGTRCAMRDDHTKHVEVDDRLKNDGQRRQEVVKVSVTTDQVDHTC